MYNGGMPDQAMQTLLQKIHWIKDHDDLSSAIKTRLNDTFDRQENENPAPEKVVPLQILSFLFPLLKWFSQKGVSEITFLNF